MILKLSFAKKRLDANNHVGLYLSLYKSIPLYLKNQFISYTYLHVTDQFQYNMAEFEKFHDIATAQVSVSNR